MIVVWNRRCWLVWIVEGCSADTVDEVSRSGWSVASVLGLMRSSLSIASAVPSCTISPVLAGVKDTAWSVEDDCHGSTAGVDVPECWLLKFDKSISEGGLTTTLFSKTAWISVNHLKLTMRSRSSHLCSIQPLLYCDSDCQRFLCTSSSSPFCGTAWSCDRIPAFAKPPRLLCKAHCFLLIQGVGSGSNPHPKWPTRLLFRCRSTLFLALLS